MPLNDTQLKEQAILDVGDISNLLGDEIDDIWARYDSLSDWERFLRSRVDAATRLMAKARFLIQTSGDGRTLHLDGVFSNARQMRNIFVGELSAYLGVSVMDATPDVTDMTAEFPVPGNEGWPDPNDPSLNGSIPARQVWNGTVDIIRSIP